MPQVTFFVPCLNEELNVRVSLEGIVSAASEAGVSYEIVVVDDCSKDNTAAEVKTFQREHSDVVVLLEKKDRTMGVGRNYVDAAFLASGEYYLMVCGDNTKAKNTIVKILGRLGDAEMVIPFFGKNDHRSWFRRTVSRTWVMLVNFLSGNSIRYYNGFALLKRSDVIRWHPDTHGFGSHAELITQLIAEGKSYCEVELTNEERESGSSSAFTIRSVLSVGHSVLNIFLRRLRRVLFRI